VVSITYFKASYLDASAAVKLVISERGSKHLHAYFADHSFFITGFCLFEALGVLKRKMLNEEISRKQYFAACYMLIAYLRTNRIRIDDEPSLNSIETFIHAEKFAKDYDLDLSDALQLLGVKHGKFCKLAAESKTVLITSDRSLAKAARTEGLRVWNCETDSEPPNE
jgi:predicted nucleic acid-binding protein